MLTSNLPIISAWLPVVDAVVKASILLAAAGLLSVVLRRASAATRHMIWTLALVGALAIPVLSIALPRWQVPVVTFAAPAAAATSRDVGIAAADPREAPALNRRPRADRERTRASVVTTAPPAARDSLPMSWASLVFLLWGIGVAAVLARVAIGVLAVHWISRRTKAADEAPWLPLARVLASEVGVSRVRFLRSRRASMPMAWGFLNPVVLMPADADEWPADRARIVLLHELAHVKRRDCFTHLLAQIACACYWFNPLAWIAARHVRRERERACDDLVLASGTRGSDYAEELLEIARTSRAERFPAVLGGASLAMAHRSQLEGRLMAILDPSVPRSGMSRVRLTVAATLAACALVPLATLQAWSVAGKTSASEAVVLPASSPAPAAPAPQPAPAPERKDRQPAADQRPRERTTEDDMAVVSTLLNTIVNTLVDSSVKTQVNTKVETRIDAAVKSRVTANVNPHIRTTVTPHVATSVGGRVGRHDDDHDDDKDDDQDAKRGSADPRTVAALTAALKDIDADVRETALQALVQLRDPAVFEPLLLALRDAAADVREQAAFGLGQLRDKRAVEPLVAALKDAVADVREQVVFALSQLRDVSTVPGLTIALHDTDADVREQAAFALGQIRDPRSVEPLISALKDANPDVREQAAFALGQIRDPRSVEPLVIALKDAKDDVREQAAFALGQIRDPRAIDGLTAALKDPSADVRQQAAFALGQLVRSR